MTERQTRRAFLRDAGLAGAGLALSGSPFARAAGRSRSRPTVAVLGGGVAGLTAAHELAERNFDVTVYERRAFGGMARSIPVPHSASGGRAPLPGEHGFRVVGGNYHHLPDTMRRIPDPVTGRSVYDNLRPVGSPLVAFANGREDIVIFKLLPAPGVPDPLTPESLLQQLVATGQLATRLPAHEAAFFYRQLAMYMSSCEERRLGQWEYVSWWDYLRAGEMSRDYQLLISAYSRTIQAVRPRVASARTFMNLAEAILHTDMGRGSEGEFFRALDAPTNEAWIDPWILHLRQLGVRLRVRQAVEALELQDGRIVSARIRDSRGRRRTICADWFVCALPMDRARRLWTNAIFRTDPRLEAMEALRTDWLNGIQFYLRREVPVVHGHVGYIESPWAVLSISQAQLWDRDFVRTYGDGEVRDCLSAIVADWNEPGILYGKPARECTPAEIAREVWAQMKAHLEDTGRSYLPDGILHSWHLDPGIRHRAGAVHNEDPLFINSVGSWDGRPPSELAIENLTLAGDYVRTNYDLATMESACESGRSAANALLAKSSSGAAPAAMFSRFEPPEYEPLRRADADRYRRGLPHVLDAR